jgi:hypothetical protein
MAAPKPFSGENNTARCYGQKNAETHLYRVHDIRRAAFKFALARESKRRFLYFDRDFISSDKFDV